MSQAGILSWLDKRQKGGILASPQLIAKIESKEPTLRLAVLIDADNAQAAVVEKETDLFVTEERKTPGSKQIVLYIRAK